ncbi:MAG: hypothetical protein J6D53_02035, partial [Blautia sp.]|nr:hypothetical protein [Blautia sp.]
ESVVKLTKKDGETAFDYINMHAFYLKYGGDYFYEGKTYEIDLNFGSEAVGAWDTIRIQLANFYVFSDIDLDITMQPT